MKLFGTDGVRGRVGTQLTADLAVRLGRAAAGYFMERGARRCLIVRDTRVSGAMLSAALASGLASVGVEVMDLGIAPTPAVSALLASGGISSFGAVVSASHNPYEDNGIKLFSPEGRKLSVPEETAIEARVKTTVELDASGPDAGQIRKDEKLLEPYFRAIRAWFPIRLKKTPLVVDAAHGAWAPHVKPLFDGMAERITYLNCDFDGTDINRGCGSTHVETLDAHLKAGGVGLAFDGDGDRMLIRIADSNPKSHHTLDGDAMLFLFAKHLVTSGPVVGTLMSNGALAAAVEKMGRVFHRAPVGDREVFERMELEGSDVGGEQSGHMILRSLACLGVSGGQRTGDGAVTALCVLKILAERYAESVEGLCGDLPAPFPQKLVNLRVGEKRPWETDAELSAAVRSSREKLGKQGRLIIRYSGTEPLIRLMAEAPCATAVRDQLEFLEEKFRRRLSPKSEN